MKKRSEKKRDTITALLLFLGIAFTVFGIYREEIPVMFEKSINICLECIGIG